MKPDNACLLAFDASVEPGSCALYRAGAVDERRVEAGQTSSQGLLPAARELLDAGGVDVDGIAAIAFGRGPGGFTGLRVACGIAQGLGFGLAVPVVPVDSLQAVALAAADAGASGVVLVAMDARMGEVYHASFRIDGGWPVVLDQARVLPPERIVIPAKTGAVAGNALAAYPLWADSIDPALARHEALLPTAAAVARLGAKAWRETGGLPPEQAVPVYVRDKVALTVAERLAAGGRA